MKQYLQKWLSAWLLTVKVIVDKEGLSFYKFQRDKNLKQQWLTKIKRKNNQSIQHVRMCHNYSFYRKAIFFVKTTTTKKLKLLLKIDLKNNFYVSNPTTFTSFNTMLTLFTCFGMTRLESIIKQNLNFEKMLLSFNISTFSVFNYWLDKKL